MLVRDLGTIHRQPVLVLVLALLIVPIAAVVAQEDVQLPNTAGRPTHGESAKRHAGAPPPPAPEFAPSLPENMTLDEVLERAARPRPAHFPNPIHDDRIYIFTLFDQLEYRVANDDAPNHLGWEAQGWIGRDFNKFWWKHEGEAIFDGPDEGESETDLLYAHLITPFWYLQIGAQYANEWTTDEYDDRWSGVVALQGLMPYKFETDTSLYVSEDGDATVAFEGEYDLRITQRLVLQPRAALGFAIQDIPDRALGAGMTDANLDLRLRYEIKREFAPYLGVRYRFLVGETEDIAESADEDPEHLYLMSGIRFAF
ncbi:MAG: copper resistance protein B [Planctomycetota bacterium]|jgi:copper resistance protein B|nr:copper resistance protein B [Planctomycetota bacterium]